MALAPIVIASFLPLVVLSLLRLNLGGVLLGLGRIREANVLLAVTPAVWMVAAFVVLALLGGDRTGAALAWIAAQAIGAIVPVAWVVTRVRPGRVSLRESVRASLRFGLEAYAANLVWTLLLRADGLLLAYLSGPEAVGIYSVAVLLAELLWYLPRSLVTALSPRVASGEAGEAASLTHRAVRSGFPIVLAAAVALALAGPPVILLAFGREFQGSILPLWLLLPGVVAGSIASPLSLYFTQQRGIPRVNAWIVFVALTLNLALNAVWIPAHGAAGAAGASSIAYAVVAALLVARFRREPGFSWSRLFRPRSEDWTPLREALGAVSPARRAR
jgi:O-antigen/teichoic acid export membrane protein